MTIYESDFTEITYDSETNILENKRKNNLDFTDETYKQENLKLAEFVEKYKPVGIIMNSRAMDFTMKPKLQEWVNENIFPRLMKAGLLKGAFVISDNLFTQISIEQTMEEKTAKAFTINYFDNPVEARAWLLTK